MKAYSDSWTRPALSEQLGKRSYLPSRTGTVGTWTSSRTSFLVLFYSVSSTSLSSSYTHYPSRAPEHPLVQSSNPFSLSYKRSIACHGLHARSHHLRHFEHGHLSRRHSILPCESSSTRIFRYIPRTDKTTRKLVSPKPRPRSVLHLHFPTSLLA